MSVTKCRSNLVDSCRTSTSVYSGSTLITTSSNSGYISDLQITTSSGHKWPPKTKKGSYPVDSGGGFITRKVTVDPGGVRVDEKSKEVPVGTWYRHFGKVYPYFYSKKCTPSDYIAPTSDSQLDAVGSLLMSRALPTNPLSGMGQFLGELRKDGLPSLPTIKAWKNRAAYFKRLGKSGSDEYLNVQFGWMPFLKDIVDFCSVVKNASKHIQQYQKDSGKPIRRRRSLPAVQNITTTVLSTSAYGVPAGAIGMYSNAGTLTRTVNTTTEQWASFCFTYYLPVDDGTAISKFRRYEALASKLFGLRITPDLLWKLAPWSWAVDWVTNAGALIRNWSAFQNDGLVLRYGYVMERKTSVTQYSLEGVRYKSGRVINCHQSIISETKSRRRATPYGFGLNPQSFSAFQWSIIAALGISKAPRSLAF